MYGDAKNAAHTVSGEASGAVRDAQSKGYDAMAKAENKANGSLLSQAENKGKSLWSGAQAEVDRLSGHAKGDASELKEVSLICRRTVGITPLLITIVLLLQNVKSMFK